jgi:hypothetical protein
MRFMKPSILWFMLATLGMGVLRFGLTIAGSPDAMVKYASMTVILIAGFCYFAITCHLRKERLKAAYLLILPYMIVEVAALSYTWATGHATIFHAPQYSFGTGIGLHTLGHLVGGLTWEPLFGFVIMEIVRFIYIRGRTRLYPARSV